MVERGPNLGSKRNPGGGGAIPGLAKFTKVNFWDSRKLQLSGHARVCGTLVVKSVGDAPVVVGILRGGQHDTIAIPGCALNAFNDPQRCRAPRALNPERSEGLESGRP